MELRPVTRHYPFFDKTANIDFVPKLIEITMTNGIFPREKMLKYLMVLKNLVFSD